MQLIGHPIEYKSGRITSLSTPYNNFRSYSFTYFELSMQQFWLQYFLASIVTKFIKYS